MRTCLAHWPLVDEQSEVERLALPMARMARFDLTRAGLRTDNPARRDAVKAQSGDIAAALRQAAPPARRCRFSAP